jgi:hypothetical protein
MKHARRLLLLLLLAWLAPGCDIALGVYFATKKSGSNGGSSLPLISIEATDADASEPGSNTGTFTITRTGSTSSALDVFFTVSGTATSGTDYTALTSPVTIPAGQLSVTLTVTPVDDFTAEVAETVIVTITNTANYNVAAPGNATVTIDDDDDDRYHVWVANLTPGEAAAQETALQGGVGNPDSGIWTEVLPVVGTQLTTAEFVPPANMNTILIQANVIQPYEIDSIEVMDSAGTVVDWPVGTVYQARMSNPNNIKGAPDGVIAVTAATATNKAIVFTQFNPSAGGIARFRVGLWRPGSQISGDLIWTRTLTKTGDQTAGGAAINNVGMVYASFHDDATRDTHVVRYDSAGVASAITTVATVITATEGSHSIAVDDTNSAVYVAATVEDGNVGIEKYSLDMVDTTPTAGTFFFKTSFTGAERVEANGITVDSAGNVIVAGGFAIPLQGIDHWMMKLNSSGGQLWALPPTQPADSGDTWWRAVATDSANQVFGAGDLNSGGSLDILTQRVSSLGVAGWSATLSNPSQVDLGNAIAIDLSSAANDVVVAGFQTVAGQGKDGIIRKYTNAGAAIGAFAVNHNGPANGDDEILDIAIDSTNGAIYAVGYETVPGQGTNMWIRRYSSTGAIVWTRTHHHAGAGNAGNDRAVSVALNGAHVIVVGDITLAGGGKEIHVRRYVK